MLSPYPAPSRRGRPAIVHDSRRVQAFVANFSGAYELGAEFPPLDDLLTGVVHLRTGGDTATRPLSKRVLFRILSTCSVISTEATARVLRGEYGSAAVIRYTTLSRVASKAIEVHLDRNPGWETEAARATQARAELDAPYFAELRAAGVM